MDYTCTYQDIFGMIKEKFKLCLDEQLQILEEKITLESSESFTIDNNEKDSLKKLLCNIKSRWLEVHRSHDAFLKKNKKWLQTSITILVINFIDVSKTRVMGQDV